MSSTGQIIGGIVGAFIGFWVGNPMLGASIGMAIGGAIDPPKGPKIEGPRLSDLAQQTSAYGLTIPRVYGTTALHGNIFWIENNSLKEVSGTSEQGGKGGGGAEVTEYSYFATFALGLCEGPIDGIGRIWCNGKLIADLGSTDYQTIIATNLAADQFTLYTGTSTQLPNPRMQATLGINNVPAYRGLAYIVVEDFALADYGNTLAAAQFKVEIFANSTLTQSRAIQQFDFYSPYTSSSFSPATIYVGLDKVTWAVPQWEANYPATSEYWVYDGYPDGTIIQTLRIPCPGNGVPPQQSGRSGVYLYNQNQVFSGGSFTSVSGFIYEYNGIYVGTTNSGGNSLYVAKGLAAGEGQLVLSIGFEFAACTDGTFAYIVGTGGSRKYFINWSTHTLDLIYSGPGQASAITRGSRVTIDEQTGKLLYTSEPSSGTMYEYSDDLSTYSVYATGIDPDSGANATLFSDGQIMIWTSGWGGTGPDRKLGVEYHVLRIASGDPIPLGNIVSSECLRSKVLTSGDIDVTSLTDLVRGYTVGSAGALRASIDPLRGSWPFDIAQAGYKVKFIRRGVNSSIATIPTSLLAATSKTNDTIPRLTQSREMDDQLPYRVLINYIDINREYDLNSQYTERLVTSSVNIRTLDMPIVLTPDEAAQKCEILLYLYWLERSDFSFNLPPSYAYVEIGDIVTITDTNNSFSLRIVSIQYNNDGVLECKARLNNSTTYVSSAVGDNSGAAPAFRETIPVAGPAMVELLDIPVIFDQNTQTSFVVASSGITSYWNGSNLYRTLDAGQNWSLIHGFIDQSKIGYVPEIVPSPITFSLMDKSSVMIIKMFGGKTLSSVSELQLLNGANYFAYGADGRWEIIGAQTAVLQSDGSYYLYNLLRGRFGTEDKAKLHERNDHLILLDTSFIQQSLMTNSQINLDYVYRIVEYGANINDKSDIHFSYKGNNLECLSPVYSSGSRNIPSTNDWTIYWIRRTRVGGELRDKVDATLSETTEAYEIDIFADNRYTVVKRTITGITSPSAVYTAAQQTTDFGAVQSQLYVGIYQLSSVVGRGQPLLTTVPYMPPTLGLAHCENLVNEVPGASISLGGNAYITTTNAKFGTSCIYTNSSGYINFNSSNAATLYDFTFEFFSRVGLGFYPVYGNLIIQGGVVYMNGTSVITGVSDGTQGYMRHVALTRKNGVVKLWANGVQIGTTGNYSTVINLSNLQVGWFGGGPLYTSQYYDEIRLSNVCLYESTFSPPISEFQIPSGVY